MLDAHSVVGAELVHYLHYDNFLIYPCDPYC
jgi:hypothetical protein